MKKDHGKPTFWQWLQKRLSQEQRKKLYEELSEFIRFPMWETIIGIFTAGFSIIWWFNWFDFPLFVAIPMSILQVIVGILILFHADYRENITY